MLNNLYASIFTFVITVFCIFGLNAQCSFPNELIVNDDSITVYNLNIDGAINNNLMTNGICAVRIKFKHNIIGELSIRLQSPNGEIVDLVGPTTPISNLTTFTDWDIYFTPCGSAASPDLGFPSIFNTLEPWGQFANYTGTYYPNNGCLEDFDTGSVNGTWSLIVEDISLFDAGEIELFEIYFCDDTGISCESCLAIPGAIPNDDLIACFGDSRLDVDINLDFSSGISDPNEYTSIFAIFDETSLIEYSPNVDLTSYTSGRYEVCHFVYDTDQQLQIPPIGTNINLIDFETVLASTGICAQVGQECMIVEIEEPGATIDIFRTICVGDSIEVFGEFYGQAGTYNFVKSDGVCDSMFLINISEIEINANISPIEAAINCQKDTITLEVFHDVSVQSPSYQWYTDGGEIIGVDTLPSIEIDSVGKYIVEVMSQGCKSTDTIDVGYDSDTPVITLRADTLTCDISAATITISSSIPLVTRDWTGPGIVAEGSLTLKADVPGIYHLIGTAANGCVGEAEIELIGDIDPPSLSFVTENIRCASDSGYIEINGLLPSDSIHWVNPVGFGSEDLIVFPDVVGSYYLESFAENGCSKVDTFNITDDRYTLSVDFNADTLTCAQNPVFATVNILDSIGRSTYIWTFPSGDTTSMVNPPLDEPGFTKLEVIDSNECTGEFVFEIPSDLDPPLLLVEDTIFTCIYDSIQIGILNHQPGFTYDWEGPIFFESSDQEPYIYHDGTYTVEVTATSGCSNTAIIEVVEGPDLPKSNFNIQNLDCFNDTATIVPTTSAGFTFEWEGPSLISPTSNQIAEITSAGVYIVTITQTSDNCRNSYEFEIEDTRSYISITADNDNLDCKTDTIVPNVQLSGPYSEVNWTGPSIDVDGILEPKLFNVGSYYITVVGDNGCSSTDSIQVDFDGDLPVISVEQNTIVCNPEEALQVLSSPRGTFFTWKYNDQVVSTDDTLSTKIAGPYIGIVEDENGCIDSVAITVAIDTLSPPIELSIDQPISCDDTISIINSLPVDPNYGYFWVGPNIVADRQDEIEINGGGTYILEIVDDRGCFGTDTLVVDDSRVEPDFDLSASNINCNGNGTIELIEQKNLTNTVWTGPENIVDDSFFASVAVPGVYSITGMSAQGCSIMKSIVVQLDTLAPTIVGSYSDTVNCYSPTAQIGVNVSGDFDSIRWTGAINTSSMDSFIVVADQGQYTANVIGLNGCSSTVDIDVVVDTIASNATIIGDTLTCLQSKALLLLSDYSNIKSIHWTGAGFDKFGPDLFINVPGEFQAEIETNNGCKTIAAFEVIEDKDPPQILLQDTFYLPCNGDSLQLFMGSEDEIATYRWTGATYFAQGERPFISIPEKVTLTIAGQNGCNNIDSTIVVMDDRPIEFSFGFDTITCNQPFSNLIAIDVEDDESFYWELPNGIIDTLVSTISSISGPHKLVVNRGNNCIDSILFEVPIDTLQPIASIFYNDHYQCNNTTVVINGVVQSPRNSIQYDWTTIDGNFIIQDSISVIVDSEGEYFFMIVDSVNGCSDQASIVIEREPQSLISAEFNLQDPLCLGDQNGLIEVVSVNGGFGNVVFNIGNTDFENGGVFDSLSSGTYYISAMDSFECFIDTILQLNQGLSYEVEIIGDTLVALGDSTLLTFEDNQGNLFYDSIGWSSSYGVECEDCDDTFVAPVINTFYQVYTVTENGCIATDSILIKVDASNELDFPNAFSPNGDDQNDVFKIPTLKEIDFIKSFQIFDRWGNMVHQEYNKRVDDQVGWNGILDGRRALPAVYVVLTKVVLINGKEKEIASTVTLLR